MDKLPFPNLDRPFGIELWPIFDKAYELVVGTPAHDFEFHPGYSPLSTIPAVASAIVAYYFVIWAGWKTMQTRQPMKLNGLFMAHNLVLTVVSAALLALFIEQLLPIVWRNGIFYSICSSNCWTQKIVTLYYMNYLTKYIELIDTVFLFLKKKPLQFLHVYHHGATAVLCFTQLIGHTSVSYVPITLNLMVHVVMYWYYFQAARGVRVWWKEWVTRIQIIQFVLDLFFVYFATYTYFASNYFPWMPNNGTCAGEEFAAIFGCALLTSYLFLFIGFYAATYSRKGRVRANRALSTGEIAIDPKFTDKDLFANGNGSALTKDVTPPSSSEGKATGATAAAVNGKPNTRSRRI